MADLETGHENMNCDQIKEQLEAITFLVGILEIRLLQYDEESAQRIGDELLNCLTILKFQFNRFAFRLKSLLPT